MPCLPSLRFCAASRFKSRQRRVGPHIGLKLNDDDDYDFRLHYLLDSRRVASFTTASSLHLSRGPPAQKRVSFTGSRAAASSGELGDGRVMAQARAAALVASLTGAAIFAGGFRNLYLIAAYIAF